MICERDEDYAETILKLLTDEPLRQGIKQNIRNYVKGTAGWSNVAQRHIDVYHKVVTVPYGKARYVYFPEPEDAKDRV